MSENIFGENLRQVLNSLDMSQAELAEKTGLTSGAVNLIINGERDPGLKSIMKILNVIPVKFERLMGRPEGKKKSVKLELRSWKDFATVGARYEDVFSAWMSHVEEVASDRLG
ncbi:DNA-binding transcriptional repressor PuuR [compost metagenome]